MNEVDLQVAIRAKAEELRLAVEAVESTPGADRRAAAIARTHFETGMLWLKQALPSREES